MFTRVQECDVEKVIYSWTFLSFNFTYTNLMSISNGLISVLHDRQKQQNLI